MRIVSSDTAISISFGTISVFISLLGVWISYLTLRVTTINVGIDSSFPSSLPSKLSKNVSSPKS
jgi:hypothetical protein